MHFARIIHDLHSEHQAIEKAILSVEILDRRSNGRTIMKPNTTTASELRWRREHMRYARRCLGEYYLLTRQR
jgi:hypothetical protein